MLFRLRTACTIRPSSFRSILVHADVFAQDIKCMQDCVMTAARCSCSLVHSVIPILYCWMLLQMPAFTVPNPVSSVECCCKSLLAMRQFQFPAMAAVWHRNLGKVLFMDEDRLKVPFLAGSMADAAFISPSNPKGTPTGIFCLA